MDRSSKIRETDIIKFPDISYDRMLINQVVLSIEPIVSDMNRTKP